MSDFINFCKDALADVMRELGSNIVYKGTTYKAVVSDVAVNRELLSGGFLTELQTVVVIQKHLLVEPPKDGERLTVEGRQVRIISVEQDEISYTLNLETASR